MLINFQEQSFAPKIRNICIKNKDGVETPLITLGKRSYIFGSDIELATLPLDHILIGNYTAIGHDVHFQMMTQHDYTLPSIFPWNNPYSKVFDCDWRLAGNERRQIIIGHDVWIGRGVRLQGGVRIGDGAVVAANSIVTGDIQPYSIVGGAPARHIKWRFSPQVMQQMKKIRWWDWAEEKIIANQNWMQVPAGQFCEHFIGEIDPGEDEDWNPVVLYPDNKNYLMIVDPEEKIPLWPKIVTEYVQFFKDKDAVSLLLAGPYREHPGLKAQIQKLVDQCCPEAVPHIVMFQTPPVEQRRSWLSCGTLFITNRQPVMLAYLSECDKLGIPFVSGVDSWVFQQKSHCHKPFPG